MSKSLKIGLIIALLSSLLVACGTSFFNASYPLESVTQNGSQVSKVYRAENKSIPQVAQELADQKKPQEISKSDSDHMFLIYSDEWDHLQRDPQKANDTLIEVDSKEFVQQNYNPSFLEGFVAGTILNELFNSMRGYTGTYRGYASKEIYKPKTEYHAPTQLDKKTIPPLTIEKKGSINRRGNQSPPDINNLGDSKITKDPTQSSSKGNSKYTPPVIKKGGAGRIIRRK